MRQDSYEFLAELVRTPSPSGHEQAVGNLYREYIGPHVTKMETDVHGNVTASIGPDAPMQVLLAAHMDEVGFAVRYIDEQGLLFVGAIGGQSGAVPIGQVVWVHGRERIVGAVGRKAIHLLEGAEQKKLPEIHDLWIDIGAQSREEAAAVVRLGDVVTYQYEMQTLLGNRATARAFDNKAGLFVVAEALRILREDGGLQPDVGVLGLASVEEEVGSRGAEIAAAKLNPQSDVAVDMEHALDYPGIVKAQHGTTAMGEGPVIHAVQIPIRWYSI
jgi:putative aminopeptidase FrvX